MLDVHLLIMDNKHSESLLSHSASPDNTQLETITIQVPADLCRAFQRCSWIVINETGKNRLQIMEEMVRDFLIKHGC
jgi:uncharacterized protein